MDISSDMKSIRDEAEKGKAAIQKQAEDAAAYLGSFMDTQKDVLLGRHKQVLEHIHEYTTGEMKALSEHRDRIVSQLDTELDNNLKLLEDATRKSVDFIRGAAQDVQAEIIANIQAVKDAELKSLRQSADNEKAAIFKLTKESVELLKKSGPNKA